VGSSFDVIRLVGVNTLLLTFNATPVPDMPRSGDLVAEVELEVAVSQLGTSFFIIQGMQPQVRVHDLKHTFGRHLRAAGVSFEDRPGSAWAPIGKVATTIRLPSRRELSGGQGSDKVSGSTTTPRVNRGDGQPQNRCLACTRS